jgi:1-acyl-sn-glycerol-3-phosphate acyltransferase
MIAPSAQRAIHCLEMQLVGSLAFTAFFFAWTFLYAIVFVVLGAFVPFPRRFVLARLWASVLLKVLGWTCGLSHTVEGRENLPAGNHVALWKHSSSWETIAMNVIFPRQVWVLKRELQWIPIVGWGIRMLHAIAIDRRQGHVAVGQVVEQGEQRLAEGDWVTIFPEGTRMAPGETRKYGVSGALLASQTGKLIVPVAHNAGYYWPRRGLRKKRGLIRVVIGPPIECAGRDPREINEQAQHWIEAEVAKIAPPGLTVSSVEQYGN